MFHLLQRSHAPGCEPAEPCFQSDQIDETSARHDEKEDRQLEAEDAAGRVRKQVEESRVQGCHPRFADQRVDRRPIVALELLKQQPIVPVDAVVEKEQAVREQRDRAQQHQVADAEMDWRVARSRLPSCRTNSEVIRRPRYKGFLWRG